MALEVRSRSILRFGVFEVDVRAGELRKQGVRISWRTLPTTLDSSKRCRGGGIASSHPLRVQMEQREGRL
jgi:hypothetical protein